MHALASDMLCLSGPPPALACPALWYAPLLPAKTLCMPCTGAGVAYSSLPSAEAAEQEGDKGQYAGAGAAQRRSHELSSLEPHEVLSVQLATMHSRGAGDKHDPEAAAALSHTQQLAEEDTAGGRDTAPLLPGGRSSGAASRWAGRAWPASAAPVSVHADAAPQRAALSAAAAARPQPWWRMRPCLLALAGSAVITFVFSFIDEATPLLASAPQSIGGLSMPEHRLAAPLAFSGVLMVAYNMLLFPTHQRVLGQVVCVQLGLALAVPSALLLPVASLFASVWGAVGVLFVATGVKSIAKSLALSSSNMLVNLLAPPDQVGAVNGAAMTIASFSRTLGPATAGAVWAASIALARPGQQFLPFGMVASAACGAVVLYSRLRLQAPPPG